MNKENDDKYLQDIFNTKKFTDPEMKQCVFDFASYCISIQNTNNRKPNYSIIHSVIYEMQEVVLSNIEQHIFSSLTRWEKENHVNRKSIYRFLVYLCEYGFIANADILRILDFSEYLANGVVHIGFVKHLLQDKRYKDFKNSPFFADRDDAHVRNLYVLEIEYSDFQDYRILEAITNLFYNTKYHLTAYSVRTLVHKLHSIQQIATYLANATCDKLTLEFMKQAILDCRSMPTKTDCLSPLIETLSLLIRSNYLCDEGLRIFISNYSNSSPSVMTPEFMLQMLGSEEISYWAQCPYRVTSPNNCTPWRYINCKDHIIRSYIQEFLYEFTNCFAEKRLIDIFCENFDNSLNDTFNEFNIDTLIHQIRYFASMNEKPLLVKIVASFYRFLYNYKNIDVAHNNKYIAAALHRQRIADEIASGYQIFVYNPLSSCPDIDKWIVCYQRTPHSEYIDTEVFDFSSIQVKLYKKWFKEYVWYSNGTIRTKRDIMYRILPILHYISNLKSGKILSIFSPKGTPHESITVSEINAIRNYIASSSNNSRTRNGTIASIRMFFNYISDVYPGAVPAATYYLLRSSPGKDYDSQKAIPITEIEAIAKVMKRNAETDILYAILYAVFYLALETEFRGSQIMRLTKDCVHEAAKKDEWVVLSDTKTSAGELTEQPITRYVKREIDEVIKLTETYRQNCSDTRLKNLLFIVPDIRKGVYVPLKLHRFNNYLKDCCKIAGTPEYSMQNLRDTHMTLGEEYVVRNALSDIEQCIISGHKSTATDTIHYVDPDIKTMLEATYGIIIGNVDVEGKILKQVDKKVATSYNEVSHSCGYCNSSSCHDFSYLDCLMCKDFVTAPDRLPFFEERIKSVDELIQNATIPHDKEDLVNIKRLLLHYVEGILQMKEGM